MAVPRPAGLYRITQGVHVATGIAAIPLLFAKLWTVYAAALPDAGGPRRGPRPRAAVIAAPRRRARCSLLVTGVANIDLWYPWPFFFPAGHYWMAWVTIGALIVHIGAKIHVTRTALALAAVEPRPSTAPRPGAGSSWWSPRRAS